MIHVTDSAQGAKKQLQREQSVENEGCVGFFLVNPSFHRQLSASTVSCSQQPVVECSSRKPPAELAHKGSAAGSNIDISCVFEKGQKVTGLAVSDPAWPHLPPMAGEQACRSSSVWDLGAALYLEKVQSAFLEVLKK